jgi:hypothetical protein
MTYDKTDEFLAHFGVKGMHWGQRNVDPGAPLTRNYHGLNRKPTKAEIIEARKNEAVWGIEANRQVKEIKKNRREFLSEDVLSKALNDDKDPDALVAVYKTNGEKIATALLRGPVGLYLARDAAAIYRRSDHKSQDYVRRYGNKRDKQGNARKLSELQKKYNTKDAYDPLKDVKSFNASDRAAIREASIKR